MAKAVQRDRKIARRKPSRPSAALANRVRVAGSGTLVTLEVPCIETKPRSNVEPNAARPLNVIVAGNVRLFICGPPRVVVAPLPPTIEQALKNDAAPPLIWHWALLAIPVLF